MRWSTAKGIFMPPMLVRGRRYIGPGATREIGLGVLHIPQDTGTAPIR